MLTKIELEATRTAADMLDWVHTAHERFRATQALRAAVRDGKFFAKELVEEALPIALFAHRYYKASSDVRITHVLGNQSYDAIVDHRRAKPGSAKYMEATVSDWSYVESLRLELLTLDGHAPGYGPVTAEGAKGRRTELRAEAEFIDHNELREQHIAGVIAAVKKKVDNRYPDSTALVARVDDAVPFREDADIAELDRAAPEILLPVRSRREFRALALEGSRAVHVAYDL